MNVNKVLTKDYDKKTLGERRKKQSQTNPNKPNVKKVKMNITVFYTKGYENMSNWAICENEPKTNPNKAKKISRYDEQEKRWAVDQEQRERRSRKVKLRI